MTTVLHNLIQVANRKRLKLDFLSYKNTLTDLTKKYQYTTELTEHTSHVKNYTVSTYHPSYAQRPK